MPLDKGIFQDVAKRINEIEGLKPMDFASTTLEQAIVEWDGVAVADEFKFILKEDYIPNPNTHYGKSKLQPTIK